MFLFGVMLCEYRLTVFDEINILNVGSIRKVEAFKHMADIKITFLPFHSPMDLFNLTPSLGSIQPRWC